MAVEVKTKLRQLREGLTSPKLSREADMKQSFTQSTMTEDDCAWCYPGAGTDANSIYAYHTEQILRESTERRKAAQP